MALLEIDGLSHSFSGLQALADVTFDVYEKEVVGLIGPNGAGKSTLLNCVSRFYQPDSGRITYQGRDLFRYRMADVATMGIRRTFQNLELFHDASVLENVTLGLIYRYRAGLFGELFALPYSRRARRAATDEARQIVSAYGLDEVVDVRVSELPYGKQKTVELARALAGYPKLLLLDEPAAGMNPEESRTVAGIVRRLCDDSGIAVLLIEHDMRVVMSACDRVVVLDHGEKIAEGTPAEIRRSPAIIKAYLGDEVDHA